MTDDEILELFGQSGDEERTTPEVAAQLGISKPATWKRLNDLYERGLIERHPAGELHSVAWSLSDDGRAYLEGELEADSS